MPFEIGAYTDVGRRRTGNEDAWDVLTLDERVLCTVADGMGGHQAGEVASHLAVEAIRGFFADGQAAPESAALAAAIQQANSAVIRGAADPAHEGMGTTVICALLDPAAALLANVGDSPAFLVRGQQALRLTQDHSWVAEELARGMLRPEEAAVHPYRHVLTRCLGLSAEAEVQLYEPVPLEAGDVLVLCSDGLSEHVQPEELPAIVAERPADAAARALVDLANERGGTDNVTVIVARRLADEA